MPVFSAQLLIGKMTGQPDMAIGHVLARGPHQSLLRNKQKRLFKPSLSSCYLFDTHIANVFRFENKSSF